MNAGWITASKVRTMNKTERNFRQRYPLQHLWADISRSTGAFEPLSMESASEGHTEEARTRMR